VLFALSLKEACVEAVIRVHSGVKACHLVVVGRLQRQRQKLNKALERGQVAPAYGEVEGGEAVAIFVQYLVLQRDLLK
jgi:hypothetical protein